MGKSKHKQQSRRERREQRKQERKQAEAQAERDSARGRVLTTVSGLGTLGAALGIYLSELPSFWLGMSLLLGGGLTLTLALGGLGGGVKPRDRNKSGNIDFGG